MSVGLEATPERPDPVLFPKLDPRRVEELAVLAAGSLDWSPPDAADAEASDGRLPPSLQEFSLLLIQETEDFRCMAI